MVGTSSPFVPTEAFASIKAEGEAPFGPQPLHLSGSKSFDTNSLTTETIPTTEATPYTEVILNSLVSLYHQVMATAATSNSTCHADCSGRGECLNGTCFCSVQYEGESCRDPNVAYFASFSCIFFFIAAISLGQLVVCIRAEYLRMKTPTLRRACGITTQKMLYIITFVAAAIRGAYFSSPSNAELILASSFLSSFYPAILSGGSLIVCFWAEAFHLRDVGCERPRFLGKSFLGFVIFNVIVYSLFVAEVFLQRETTTEEERRFLTHLFNGCYAVLMFIMVVFFLIYGVEVYFKVRGGFVSDTVVVGGTLHSRLSRNEADTVGCLAASKASAIATDVEAKTSSSVLRYSCSDSDHEEDGRVEEMDNGGDNLSCVSKSTSTTTITSMDDDARQHRTAPSPTALGGSLSSCKQPLLKKQVCLNESVQQTPVEEDTNEPHIRLLQNKTVRVGFSGGERGIDYSQLSQSRFGLVFQACMLMITVCFLFSDVLGGFWKSRVPLISRNAYDIVFRVVELGVALWFPCVLWNCIAPEQLWILNPRKILKKIDIDKRIQVVTPESASEDQIPQDSEASNDSQVGPVRECWICYESSSSTSAGPLIEPCLCRGDVAAVHHNCLRQWLMECVQNNNTDQLACKVCQAEYELERSPHWWIGQGFTARHWLHTASLVTVMCGTIAASWAVLQMYQGALVRSITAGAMLLMLYICLRFLGFNTFTAYQRARYSAVKILSRHFTTTSSSPATSSRTSDTSSSPTRSMSSASTEHSELYADGCPVATISGGQVTVNITAPTALST